MIQSHISPECEMLPSPDPFQEEGMRPGMVGPDRSFAIGFVHPDPEPQRGHDRIIETDRFLEIADRQDHMAYRRAHFPSRGLSGHHPFSSKISTIFSPPLLSRQRTVHR